MSSQTSAIVKHFVTTFTLIFYSSLIGVNRVDMYIKVAMGWVTFLTTTTPENFRVRQHTSFEGSLFDHKNDHRSHTEIY